MLAFFLRRSSGWRRPPTSRRRRFSRSRRGSTFTPTLDQFRNAFRIFDVASLVESSLLIAGGSTLLSLLLGVPAGYALARSQHPLAMALAYFFMAVRMVPAVAALIPFYLMMRDVHLLGSWVSVVLINSVLNSAFVTWMMFSYFRSLPKELEEAALTDGCTQFGAFYKVALPAARSGVIASALFCTLFAWNDFLYPMFLTRLDSKPISVALLSAYGTKDITWGTLGRACAFLDDPDRADRARAQPLFRPGRHERRSLERFPIKLKPSLSSPRTRGSRGHRTSCGQNVEAHVV